MAYTDVFAIEQYFKELERIVVPKENQELAKKFLREEKVKGIKESTLRWKLYTLLRLCSMFPNKKLVDMSKDDIVNFLHDVKPRSTANHKDKAKTDFSETTKVLFKINIKNFFKWLNGGKQYPESVDWIYAAGDTSKKIDEKDILTPEDVLAMVNKAGTTRDAAFIYTIFETGCRASEWLNIKYSDISLEGRTATIKVDGKTGKRTVYLINSLSYLRDWLNVHPFKDKDDFPIWISMERLSYGHRILLGSMRKNLLRIKKMAGIKKPVNPHAFRHARATDCARRGYQESLMRKMFGWANASNMPSVYIHLVSKDVKDKLLSDAGLEQSYTQTSNALDLIDCPKCGKKYGAGTKFCTCGFILDEKEAQNNSSDKNENALATMQTLISEVKQLEAKGFDLQQFNKFMESWAKANTKQ
ncbi:MAG: tyrosine-type recombinase/integrase [Candidatus ainarchaeum sp.]|nr:tyrosine-type recombinase/integrase [Candidatus ainarchaeum sp.]